MSCFRFQHPIPFFFALLLQWGIFGLCEEASCYTGPTSIVVREDAVFVAGRLSGQISVFKREGGKVTSHFSFGRFLGNLAAVPGTNLFVAPAENSNELLLLRWHDNRLDTAATVAVPGTPVHAEPSPDGRQVSVSSLWGRSLSVFRIENSRLVLRTRIALPFSPRLQWWSSDGAHLVVADSHGGHLAVIETVDLTVRSIRHCNASGIRGIVQSKDGHSLLLAHNRVSQHNPTTQPMVFYGFVVSSGVLVLDLGNLLASSGFGEIHHFAFHPFGDVKTGAGDPGEIRFLRNGGFAACFSGVNEVAVGDGPGGVLTRIPVGRRPLALAESEDGNLLYVANYFDDTISEVDISQKTVLRTLRLNKQRSPENTVRKGTVLFHDARVSLHGWSSCNSCHVDGHTTGGLADTLGDGTIYTPKRIPSLFGTTLTGPWGWDGKKASLHDQILQSMRITMQGTEMKKDTPENAALLATYLETLKMPEVTPKADNRRTLGRRVFDELGGGLWNGRVAGLGESLDDRRLAGAGAAGNHDKFCCH